MIEVGSREWIRATLALSLGSFLVFLNLYQTHPLLPLLAEVFSVSALSASWTSPAAPPGSRAPCSSVPVWRTDSDGGGSCCGPWIGAILLSLCIPWVTRFDLLVSLRILQGALLAGLPATAIAYMGKSSASVP